MHYYIISLLFSINLALSASSKKIKSDCAIIMLGNLQWLPDVDRRSSQKKIMDEQQSGERLKKQLEEIEEVNRMLNLYKSTMLYLEKFFESHDKSKILTIVDIGTGIGGKLVMIQQLAEKMSIRVKLYGVDSNAMTTAIAKNANSQNPNIIFLTTDVLETQINTGLPKDIDIVLFSNVLHHLSDGEIVKMLSWATNNAKTWFFRDLQRRRFSYLVWRYLLSWSMFRNLSNVIEVDGAISILRGFTIEDIKQYITEAGIDPKLVTIKKDLLKISFTVTYKKSD